LEVVGDRLATSYLAGEDVSDEAAQEAVTGKDVWRVFGTLHGAAYAITLGVTLRLLDQASVLEILVAIGIAEIGVLLVSVFVLWASHRSRQHSHALGAWMVRDRAVAALVAGVVLFVSSLVYVDGRRMAETARLTDTAAALAPPTTEVDEVLVDRQYAAVADRLEDLREGLRDCASFGDVVSEFEREVDLLEDEATLAYSAGDATRLQALVPEAIDLERRISLGTMCGGSMQTPPLSTTERQDVSIPPPTTRP
jgi:hypothetical protein